MGEPLFLFAGAYEHIASAEGDYEVIRILRSTGDLVACDAAVVAMRQGGVVEVQRAERPAAGAAWVGRAAGAAIAVASREPPAGPETDAGLGAWFEHLEAGTPPADAGEIAELIAAGRAALIVVGIAADAGRIEQTAVEATQSTLKHLPDTDFDVAERRALEAMGRA